MYLLCKRFLLHYTSGVLGRRSAFRSASRRFTFPPRLEPKVTSPHQVPIARAYHQQQKTRHFIGFLVFLKPSETARNRGVCH